MRVTTGKFLRRFVYCWKHGHRDVVRVMRGGLEIWPGEEARIRRIAVDMSGMEGSVTDAYWQHALAHGPNNNVRDKVSLTIAGREYCLGRSVNRKPTVSYSHGWLDFGDDGPALRDVRVGDVLVVQASVPRRETDTIRLQVGNGSLETDIGLPWLKGTSLWVEVNKGQKKVSAGSRFKLTGVPSGTVHIEGWTQKNGHCRGLYSAYVTAQKERVIDGETTSWHAEAVAGDTNLRLSLTSYNNASNNARVKFPSFTYRFKLKVIAVEL